MIAKYKIEPGAQLARAYLEHEDLSGADLTGANLYRAELNSSNLSGAILSGADLEGADLGQANLRGANLRGADLRLANLAGADLRGADLSDAILTHAMLYGADLTGANLSGALLGRARFYCADLTGAVLPQGQLSLANFSGAIMPGPGEHPSYKNINTDKELKTLLARMHDAKTTYEATEDYDEYEDRLDAAESLMSSLCRCVERALDIVRPQFDHRESVIATLTEMARATLRHTDPDEEDPADEVCADVIYWLKIAYTKIVNLPDSKRDKADLPAFLSEIGLKIDVEVKVTPENQERIIARLDQLASDVARLAGISKEETPAKTVLAAIEVSNLTPEIMELVSDAVLDCAEME